MIPLLWPPIIINLILIQFETSNGATILMTSVQFPSHIQMQLEFGRTLVQRGHELYIAVGSRYPQKDAILKMGMKVLEYNVPEDVLYGVSKDYDLLITNSIYNKTSDMPVTSTVANRDCTTMMEDQTFLNEVRNLNFDLAVVEPFVLSSCTLLLPHYLNIPFVTMVSFLPPWRVRIPALPSYFPVLNPFQKLDESSLLGRIEMLLSYILIESGILFPGITNTTLLELYAPELSSWGELVRKSEMHFVTSDHNIGPTMPTFPNVITIAGLTCGPGQNLDPKFENLMVGNRNGVILMSFGSTAYYMPNDVVIKFLDAFSKVKQTVIARLPVIEGVKAPKNVHLIKWLPQNDILGHPNTKLFITHCGSNGQHEALYHAVPMIGFPLFAEQPMNCRTAEAKGFGLTMSITDFTSTELYNNIIEVLDNSKYKSAIEHASERFRAQPMSAQEKIRFWVDYVLRYGGKHLRSPANDLPLYQFLMLDVLCVLTLLLITGLCLVKTLIKFLKRRIYGHKKKPKVKFQ